MFKQKLPKDPSELDLTRQSHDVLQACLLNRNISLGLNKNKWVCTSWALTHSSPGWSMSQQILVFELSFPYREFHWPGRDFLMAEDLCGSTVAFWTWYFMSYSLVNIFQEEKVTQNQLHRSIPLLRYFLVTGQLKVNKVWTKSGESKRFQMGTRSSELIRAISTHTFQAPTKHQ